MASGGNVPTLTQPIVMEAFRALFQLKLHGEYGLLTEDGAEGCISKGAHSPAAVLAPLFFSMLA